VSDTGSKLVTLYAQAGGGDTVGMFAFGLYLGEALTPASTNRRTGKHEMILSACVLDSHSMCYGWVQKKWLKRVE